MLKILKSTHVTYFRYLKFSSISGRVDSINTDVLISGGGIIGCSTAYWIKKENPNLDVTVVERDPTYKTCSAILSVGGVRQQFSENENIKMSLFCAEILNDLNKYFSTEDVEENLDVQFIQRGYLTLSDANGEKILKDNFEKQIKLGGSLEFLSKQEIKKRWNWLNVDDLSCGVIGTANEGWFDPWLLLNIIRRKIKSFGVRFITGEVSQFIGSNNTLNEALIKNTPNSNKNAISDLNVCCKYVVNSTGAWASQIAEAAEIACGMSGNDFPLFVQPRKRYVYNFSCPDFGKNVYTPMVIDYSGLYFRRESSGDFICGLSPLEINEMENDDLDTIDYDWFENGVWPRLYNRAPVTGCLKLKSAWAGFYDYNTCDQNLIVGPHPRIRNFYLCNGSSGHGIQHAIAIGRAIMELILYDKYLSIDLSRLQYDRFLGSTDNWVFEKNII